MKNKIKEFYKEHEEIIKVALVSGIVGAGSYTIGRHITSKRFERGIDRMVLVNPELKKCFDDTIKMMGDRNG